MMMMIVILMRLLRTESGQIGIYIGWFLLGCIWKAQYYYRFQLYSGKLTVQLTTSTSSYLTITETKSLPLASLNFSSLDPKYVVRIVQ